MRPLRTAWLLVLLALGTASPPSHANPGKVKWPTWQRYREAMFNVEQHLRDPKLRGAQVQRDNRNQPIRYSGSFSSVFRITTRSGRPIALRVFHPSEVNERDSLDEFQARYKKLGNYLGDLRARGRLPPEILEFAMVPDGIKVDGQSLPIMKLPWISGRTLDSWVARRIGQGRANAVLTLAQNWRAAVRDLRAAGVAHGDLHHGNVVLESSGAMRFVDYDSMYVPTLKGLANSEIGHQNYQHPAFHFPPHQRPFDENMDNFSSIVVYLSLVAVASDPGLWAKYHVEGNNLIFEGERDFKDPDRSPVFADLKASKSDRVRGLAKLLAKYAKGPPEEVPSLEKAILAAKEANLPWYKRSPAAPGPTATPNP